jgi:DNA invertase Pin-like site-specific DNA recombinase
MNVAVKALSSSKKQNSKSKVIGYIRVSTLDQSVEKNKADIKTWVKQKGLESPTWVTENISGVKDWHKRKLAKAIDSLSTGDWLVIPEFSRLARSTKQVLDILAVLKQKGVNVFVLKGNQLVNGSIESKVFVTMMALFAEIERDLISARTIEGLKASRARGAVLGRKPYTSKLDKVKDAIVAALKTDESILSIARRFKTSPQNLYAWFKRRGIIYRQAA